MADSIGEEFDLTLICYKDWTHWLQQNPLKQHRKVINTLCNFDGIWRKYQNFESIKKRTLSLVL
ncbi:hypothetical protein MXB_68 [Myxobolus squamalis]|nr:hypothetical protein MXB_68 [Myxobolus squamalis]